MSNLYDTSRKVTVRDRNDKRRSWINLIVGLILGAIIGYMGYALQHAAAPNDVDQLRLTLRNTEQQKKQAIVDLESVKSQLIASQRNIEVDKAAYTELTEKLEQSDDNIARLKEELSFYRSILRPENADKPIELNRFKLQPNQDKTGYQYSGVVTRSVEKKGTIKMQAEIFVEGVQDGAKKVIKNGDIGVDPMSLNVQFYSEFSGTLVVPLGFEPTRVGVYISSKEVDNIEKWYPWDEVVQH